MKCSAVQVKLFSHKKTYKHIFHNLEKETKT